MRVPKKLLNNTAEAAKEQFFGFMDAMRGELESVGTHTAAIRTADLGGKVAIVTGGGAGHEPMYGGYVGEGLADAVAVGDVFAAPTPDVIFETVLALNPENGVVFVYGNYAGDNMNFDIAAELLEDEGIRCHTIRVNDDVISAPEELAKERRGIAGALYVLKIAGAAAKQGYSFEQVVEVSEKALSRVASIGVAVGACALPRNKSFNFEIADDEIEIGMGLHGEPGVGKTKISTANEVVSEICTALNEALDLKSDEKVAVLVNNLGASTQMELLVANHALTQYLDNIGVHITDTLLGSYCTSLEMAGYSISILKLDQELEQLYLAPCNSFALRK